MRWISHRRHSGCGSNINRNHCLLPEFVNLSLMTEKNSFDFINSERFRSIIDVRNRGLIVFWYTFFNNNVNMFANRNWITNSSKRINKILNLSQIIRNSTTFKSELMQLCTKWPCLCICMSMKIVVDFVLEKPQTSAADEISKNGSRNGGLKPWEEQLILLLPGAIRRSDTTRVTIFKSCKPLWNLQVRNEVMKTMSTNPRLNLWFPEEILHVVELFCDGMAEVRVHWTLIRRHQNSIRWRIATSMISRSRHSHYFVDRWKSTRLAEAGGGGGTRIEEKKKKKSIKDQEKTKKSMARITTRVLWYHNRVWENTDFSLIRKWKDLLQRIKSYLYRERDLKSNCKRALSVTN